MRWIALAAMLSLTACATTTAPPDVRETTARIAPQLPDYGEAFERRLADEIEAMPGAECPRTGAMPAACSALLTYALDHQKLRDQVRKLRR